MRKLWTALAVVLLSVTLAVPAYADPDEPDEPPGNTPRDLTTPRPLGKLWGERCKLHKRYNEQHTAVSRQGSCLYVNQRGETGGSSHQWEALMRWNEFQAPWRDHVRIYIDKLQLRRESGSEVMIQYQDQWFDSWNDDGISTAWWTDSGGCMHLYTWARYKIQWLELPGDPVGDFHVNVSNTIQVDCP